MRVREFLEKHTEIGGLFVSTDGRWFSEPRKGFTYKTRIEILGTAEVAQHEESNTEAEPQTSTKKVKKTKKQ